MFKTVVSEEMQRLVCNSLKRKWSECEVVRIQISESLLNKIGEDRLPRTVKVFQPHRPMEADVILEVGQAGNDNEQQILQSESTESHAAE